MERLVESGLEGLVVGGGTCTDNTNGKGGYEGLSLIGFHLLTMLKK